MPSGIAHTLGEGYSERRPIPNVWDFRAEQQERHKHADQRAMELSRRAQQGYGDDSERAAAQSRGQGQNDGTYGNTDEEEKAKLPRGDAAPQSGKEEKEELMKKANEGHRTNKVEYKGERVVTDPVTGRDVIVKDADFGDVSLQGLDPEKQGQRGATSAALKPPPGNPNAYSPLHSSPSPASPTNILLQPYPAPVSVKTMTSIQSSLNALAGGVGGALGIIWFLTAFRSGFWAFLIRTTLIGATAIGTWFATGILTRKLEKDLEQARAEMHRKRGINGSPPVPESTEWLNALFATVWPLIDPALFTSVVDMVEDIMQASLPKFVDAVRISDLGLGDNPFRIIAMRGLPDKQQDKEYPREEWIYDAKPSDSQVSDAGGNAGDRPQAKAGIDGEKEREAQIEKGKREKQKQGQQSMNDVDKSTEELDQSGDYVNYEVSLAYQARPGKSTNQRAGNIHLLIQFFLGAYDWLHIPVPIWIQVEGLVVTVRLRMQMVPQMPYLRNLTFTLMGVPKVEISAIPMSRLLPNVLDLPLISGFVQSSIAAAANEYVAPKSMTLNMAQMLTGDGIKKDTMALGIFVITLHHAENLSAQDSDGKSDPYIVLSYAKFGKPLYSTRIIMGDLNPVFEETAVLLVSADEVKAKESLSIQLWDNDKMSADDLVGRIHVPLSELMKSPGKVQRRTDELQGFEDADKMSGTFTWSCAYYEKAKLDEKRSTKKGTAEGLPKEVKDKPEAEQQPTPADNKEESKALHIPPSREHKSGVLSVIVHQINNLERQNLKGASGSKKNREGSAGQDTDAPEEEGPNLPNSYCEIYVNDNMIYKTRTKMYTSMPFFEAGTEIFIRDWTTAVVRIAVRDAKLREHDPLLGICSAKLTDIFEGSSQVTQMMALEEGVGFGRVNVSLLFKGVEASLPKNMLGWETSTIELLSDVTFESADEGGNFKTKKLHLSTNDSDYKVPTKLATLEGNTVTWDIGDNEIRMPVYSRFANSLHFEFGGGGLNPLNSQPDAIAVLWLRDLVDHEEKQVRLPVVKGDDMQLLRQNYLNEQMLKTHPHKIVGYVTCTVLLDPGLDPDHEQAAEKTNAYRHSYEVYDHVEGQARVAEDNSHANDDGVIDKREQKQIDKAHQKALESRHRGKMQFSAVRTMVWMKDGLRSRKNALKYKLPGQGPAPSEPAIQSEV